MKYTLSILVENQPGVLSKVSALFSRRGFNIESLAVGITENPAISRITIVVDGDEHIVEQVEKQLNKLIAVIKVKNLTAAGDYISCILMLIKVGCTAKQRPEVLKIAEQMQARIADVAEQTLTLQYAGAMEDVETLTALLKPYGVKELVRTGAVAMERGAATASVSHTN